MQPIEQVQPIENNNRSDNGNTSAFHLGKEDFDIVKTLNNDNAAGKTSADNLNLPRLAIEKLSVDLLNTVQTSDKTPDKTPVEPPVEPPVKPPEKPPEKPQVENPDTRDPFDHGAYTTPDGRFHGFCC